jgi:amino acid transporter
MSDLSNDAYGHYDPNKDQYNNGKYRGYGAGDVEKDSSGAGALDRVDSASYTQDSDTADIDPHSGVKRGLKTRHLSMMALAGIIGPGL